MKCNTPCPACGEPIGLWRIMAAPTPWHLKCSKCKSKIGVGWNIVVSTLLIAILAYSAYTFVILLGPFRTQIALLYFVFSILGLALLALLLEFGFALLIINKATLRLRK